MAEGWFGNHRSLEEQMKGLSKAVIECKGKTVLDAGCAEGDIGLEFMKAGAKLVHAFDNNPGFVEEAQDKAVEGMQVWFGNINEFPKWLDPEYDIVLALAIIHKAQDVRRATKYLAGKAKDLLVVRLPFGSEGFIKAKHFPTACDVRVELPGLGFTLEETVEGPRKEWVQYWRRGSGG
jgi:SAM-dependent methyltransferase